MEELLHDLFDKTPIDFYHLAEPVIRDGIEPKNIYSALRQGYQLDQKFGDLRRKPWKALESNYEQNLKETFNAVEKNIRK